MRIRISPLTVILDLSVALNAVDHDVLLTILHDYFGIHVTALNWFKDYLHPRFFKLAVDGKYSSSRELKYGVPQGFCSGAILFTCYCSLIKDQINNSITLTAFADDHSIHKNFKAGNKVEEHKTPQKTGESIYTTETLGACNAPEP